MKRLASWLCLLVAVVALSGCGETTTTTTNAARYIYKPYRAGSFKQGAPGRKKALAKAGASALFAYHELKVAARDARCDGKTLRRLASPLSSALAALSSLRTSLGAGDLGAIGAASAALDNLTSQTRQQGVHVKDVNG